LRENPFPTDFSGDSRSPESLSFRRFLAGPIKDSGFPIVRNDGAKRRHARSLLSGRPASLLLFDSAPSQLKTLDSVSEENIIATLPCFPTARNDGPGIFRPSPALRAAELNAAVTVGAAKMPNPSFPLGLPPPPSGGRGNPDAKDGKLADASMLHLNRQPRSTATPATAGVQSLWSILRRGN